MSVSPNCQEWRKSGFLHTVGFRMKHLVEAWSIAPIIPERSSEEFCLCSLSALIKILGGGGGGRNQFLFVFWYSTSHRLQQREPDGTERASSSLWLPRNSASVKEDVDVRSVTDGDICSLCPAFPPKAPFFLCTWTGRAFKCLLFKAFLPSVHRGGSSDFPPHPSLILHRPFLSSPVAIDFPIGQSCLLLLRDIKPPLLKNAYYTPKPQLSQRLLFPMQFLHWEF